MALQKDYVFPFGVTANYWVMDRVEVNLREAQNSTMYLALYLSAAASGSGADPIMSRKCNFDASALDLQAGGVIAQCYALAKAGDPYFSDAINV